MILIGQYDSPFVRRVGIALRLYGLAFEHRPWSAFGDAEKLGPYNPLLRVPTLVLDDGETLIDSAAILDHLDRLVAPEAALFPVDEPARRRALKVAALACGLADKAVGLFYEKRLHAEASPAMLARWGGQIVAAAAALEADRAGRTTPHWFGDRLGHADIAVAAALRFTVEAHPGLLDLARLPALAAHAARLEVLPVFVEISQPFLPPA